MKDNSHSPVSAHLAVRYLSESQIAKVVNQLTSDPDEQQIIAGMIGGRPLTLSLAMSQGEFSFNDPRRPPSLDLDPPPPQPRPVPIYATREFQRALELLEKVADREKMNGFFSAEETKRERRKRIQCMGLDRFLAEPTKRSDAEKLKALHTIKKCVDSSVALRRCSQFILVVKWAEVLIHLLFPHYRRIVNERIIEVAKVIAKRLDRSRVSPMGRPSNSRKRGNRRTSQRRLIAARPV